MLRNQNKFLNLQIFSDGEAVESEVETEEESVVENGSQNINSEDAPVEDSENGIASGNDDSAKDLSEEWKKMIKGDYKSLYDKSVQKAVEKRFKTARSTEEKLTSASPIFSDLARKYGIKDTGDISAIVSAYMADDARYEAEAEELGVPTEMVKKMHANEEELERYRQADEQRKSMEAASRLYEDWNAQAKEVVKLYPSFNLEEETANPDFIKYMQMPGMDVRSAYEHAHMRDIIGAAVKSAQEKSKEDIAKVVASNRARPNESSRSSGAFTQKIDPGKLTPEQMADIRRRVRMGETIRFD